MGDEAIEPLIAGAYIRLLVGDDIHGPLLPTR
jgi:hypothetical protein